MNNTNMITAKYEAIFPFDILLNEKGAKNLAYDFKEGGGVLIYAPELIHTKNLHEGRYGSRLYIDVTLDINKKPVGLGLDRFFAEKCIDALIIVLREMWFYTKKSDIDPHLNPIFVTCNYYDTTGSPFVNPDTGKSSYEEHLPRGVVLSKDSWEAVGTNLMAGTQRNLDEILLLNAKCMRGINRPEIAILLAAIACEYKVKYVCDILAKKKKVPVKLWSTVVEKLRLRFAEYQELMRSLGIASMESSPDPKIRALPSRLRDLFGHRNMIAHRGSIQGYKGKQFTGVEVFSLADKDIETAEQFVTWLDSQVTLVK